MNSKLRQNVIFAVCIFSQTFFYVAKNIYVFQSNNAFTIISTIAEVLAYIGELYLIASKHFASKYLKMIAAFIVIFLINYYLSGNATLLRSFLIVLASYNLPFKKAIKPMISAYFLAISLSLLLFVLRISYSAHEYRGHYGYGFSGTNIMAKAVTILILLIFCLHWEFRRKEYILFFIGVLLSAFAFSTRTATVSFILFLPLLLIYKKVVNDKKEHKVIKWSTVGSFAILLAISVLLVIYYRKSAFVGLYLDNLLNIRLFENYNSVMNHGIPLMGQKVDLYYYSSNEYQVFQGFNSTINSRFMTVDCTYIASLIQLGVFPTLFLLIWNGYLIKNIWEDKNYVLLATAVCLNIYAFTESGFSDIYLYFPLLYTFSRERLENERMLRGKGSKKHFKIRLMKRHSF